MSSRATSETSRIVIGHGQRSEAPGEDAFLRVQPVLGLVEHDRLRTVDHLVGDLLAAMGGQAMHEDRVLGGVAHQLGVDLIGREQVVAAAGVLVAHRHPAIGDDGARVRDRALGSSLTTMRAPAARARASRLAEGCSSSGQAISSSKSKRAEASIQDDSTLL